MHSGSRGLGKKIMDQHIAENGSVGLPENTERAKQYIEKHNEAVRWAKLNREVIADRFMKCLNMSGTRILDICHNSVEKKTFSDGRYWLHRKGAAPSDKGLVVIPGSRGATTYLVKPTSVQELSNFSLAHGAGRKHKRHDMEKRLKDKHSAKSLTYTSLGSRVICENKKLLYEEAPEAYKDIDQVVKDLEAMGLIRLIARFKPLITYKTRKES